MTPDQVTETVEHLDFDVVLPCEAPVMHKRLTGGESLPAAWRITGDRCPTCGYLPHSPLLLCNTCVSHVFSVGGYVCNECFGHNVQFRSVTPIRSAR